MINNNEFKLSVEQEEYVKIYHEYFVLNWSWLDIQNYHFCSKQKVNNAIKWVIDNRIKMPSKDLIKGAIDSLSVRLKQNKEIYQKEITKKKRQDRQYIIAILKEIREDEKTLYKMQEIYHDDEEDKNAMSPAQVLQLINEATKLKKD